MAESLRQLKALHDKGILTNDEYETKRKALTDRLWGHGAPLGWAIEGANRSDVKLLGPTIASIQAVGLLDDVDTMHLDRDDYYSKIRSELNAAGFEDLGIQKRRRPVQPGDSDRPMPMRLGLRWRAEATTSWLSNFGQLRRNTDRRLRNRHAALCLAINTLTAVELIAWRDPFTPDCRPIR